VEHTLIICLLTTVLGMVNCTHWNENNDVKIRNHPFTRMGAFCYSTSIYVEYSIEHPEFLSVVFNFLAKTQKFNSN